MAGSAERGRWVGRYELVERLAGGGVTDLFLARLVDEDDTVRLVALKQLRPEARRDATATKQFIDDVRRSAGLVHPHVGRVLEAGVDPARLDPYVALEFIAGQDLAALMEAVARNGLQLPLPVACRIVHDLCLGLHAGHVLADAAGKRLGVVHGAVTPRNVMISYGGRTRVVDFGVGATQHTLRQAFPGQLFGTLAYLAPEQVLEHPVDARTDIFAAATILFELLTGRRMHANEAAAPRAVVIEHPPAPSTLAEDVTPQLDALVLGGLEKNADDRPASAAAFARALAAAVPLADEKDVAALMIALFDAQRRATEALLERHSGEEQEEKTVSMAVPAGAALHEDEPLEVTHTRRDAVALAEDSPEATQQMTAVAPQPPSRSRAPGRRAPLPPSVESGPPPPSVGAVSPQRAAPSSAPRPPPPAADLWAPPPPAAAELWAAPPEPAAAPRARASAPPPPVADLWAPPPPPAAASRAPTSAPPPPAAELWAPPPPPAAGPRAPTSAPPPPAAELWAPPPAPAAASRAPTSAPPPPAAELWAPPPPPAAGPRAPSSAPPPPVAELWAPPPAPAEAPASPAAPAPAEAKTRPAPAPAAPAEDEEVAPSHAPKQTRWDRIRWPVALTLLAIAVAAVTWFIQTKWRAPVERPAAPEERSGARLSPHDARWA